MRINTNLTAMNTFTQYTKNNNKIANSVAKLSSGFAINSAADNAAGLAISEKMRAQIRGLSQASTNAQDAISLTQTAEGSLGASTEILQRMRELAVQSANDTNENEIDREALQDEFSQLQEELNNIASTTTFNKKNLLDGSLAKKQASTANLNLANSGLSVALGKVAAGQYTFDTIVKTESAAVAAQKSTFTAVSTDSKITVGTAGVTNNMAASSLANGNYSVEAKWDSDTKEMYLTAKGDNGQAFTATLTQAQLDAYAANPAAGDLTLKFGNGNTNAFQLTIDTTTKFSTGNDATMNTVAQEISDALSFSATGGVDAKEATYALYATMTGAEDVKLNAGMDSVTFSNGVSVSFDKLTVADVDTTNTAAMSGGTLKGTKVNAGDNTTGKEITYSNFKAADNAQFDDGTKFDGSAAISATLNGTDGSMTLTAKLGGKDYTATLSKADLETLGQTASMVTADATKKLEGVTFTAADGNSFSLDINSAITKGTNSKYGALTYAEADFEMADGSAIGVSASDWAYVDTFGDAATGVTASTFDIEVSEGAGLTFQIGANKGDELVINIDRMDADYLGVASADILSRENATNALGAVDKALNEVASQRAYLGAIQNRLDHKIANLDTSNENLTAAESQIRDVDMAKEMTNFTNANILSQAATAMLAQANSLPQNVLSLIG